MKNFLKLIPIAAAMWFGVAGGANASTLTQTGWITVGVDHAMSFASLGNTDLAGPIDFNDDFTFKMPTIISGPLKIEGGADAVSGQIGGTFTLNFEHFELWNVTTNTLIASDLALSVTPSPFVQFHVPHALYSTTDVYLIHADGFLTGAASNGAYAGTFTLSPTPEPETYAMFMAGLGLMGFIARRRKNEQS
jgi:hypothetical protein